MSCQNQGAINLTYLIIPTRDTRNILFNYILRFSTTQYGNRSLRGDGASLWNKFFKKCFEIMILLPSLN